MAFHLLMEGRDENERLELMRQLHLDTPMRRRLEAKGQKRVMAQMGLPMAGRRRR